jgi:hypothetical protein
MNDSIHFTLHPDAANTFDNRAKVLSEKLTILPKENRPEASFKPEVFIAANIERSDLRGGMTISLRDHYGNEVARYFETKDGCFGLNEEEFAELVGMVDQIIKNNKEIAAKISGECLLDISFEWVKKSFNQGAHETFSEYLLSESRKSLTENEVWIPVFGLFLESELFVGPITFKTITARMLDEHEAAFVARNPDSEQEIRSLFRRERRELQGVSAATFKAFAEPKKAREIAFYHAENAVSALRFFHFACLSVRKRCHCALLGKENVESFRYLNICDSKIISSGRGLVGSSYREWVLVNSEIEQIWKCGLNKLNEILSREERTDFELALLHSVNLFSRNSLFPNPIDRLIYACSAIESMLLKDPNEPIQQNIGDRLAFAIGKNPEERKFVANNFREIYAIRSKFLHHGRLSLEAEETVDTFLVNIWKLLTSLLEHTDKFPNTKALINLLDERKYR